MEWILKVTGTNNNENMVNEAKWMRSRSLILGYDAFAGPPAQVEVILEEIVKI